jgi:hypothetical protein
MTRPGSAHIPPFAASSFLPRHFPHAHPTHLDIHAVCSVPHRVFQAVPGPTPCADNFEMLISPSRALQGWWMMDV